MSNRLTKGDGIPFTQISNEVLYNKDLSLKAKGLWAYMLAKPDDWNFTASSMASQLKESRNTILSIMKELKDFGLLDWSKKFDGTGEYIIYHQPKKQLLKPEKQPKSKNRTLPKNSQSPKMPPCKNATVAKLDCINNKDLINNKDFNNNPSWDFKKSSLDLDPDVRAYKKKLIDSNQVGLIGQFNVEHVFEHVYIDERGRLYTDSRSSKQLVTSTLKELWTDIYEYARLMSS